jgi:hypothetical protein
MVLEISTFGTISLTVIITIVCVVFLFFVVLIYFMNKDSKEDAKLKKEEDEKGYQAITHVHAFNPGSFDSDKIIDMVFSDLYVEFSIDKSISKNIKTLHKHIELLKRENIIYNIDTYVNYIIVKNEYPIELFLELYMLIQEINDNELPSKKSLRDFIIILSKKSGDEFNVRILLKNIENSFKNKN